MYLINLIYQKILNKDVTKGIMATILKSEKGKTITFPKFPSLQQNQMKIGLAFVILFDSIEKGMNATIFDTHRDDDTISTMSKKRSENGSGVSIKVKIGRDNLLACCINLRAFLYPPGFAIPKFLTTFSLVSLPF